MGIANFNTKVSYLQSPGFPQTYSKSVMHTVQIVPVNENICQIRLDFLDFELDGGSVIDKQCDRDMFRVSGGVTQQSQKWGLFCGENSGQHLYVPVMGSMGAPVSISIVTADRSSGNFSVTNYKWNVKITHASMSF